MSPWVLASVKDSKTGHIGETSLARALLDLRKAGLVAEQLRRDASWLPPRVQVDGRGAGLGGRHAVGWPRARLPGILGTYGRATYAKQRAAALDRWCDYLDALAGSRPRRREPRRARAS
jgi:hypothetical protein